jgi:hypothetical protein
MRNGAKEPVFGAPTGAMKTLAKKTGKDQALSEALYATGNYDAMYFAGMIAEPDAMSRADFERWMEGAYFFMLSDFVVAVTLAESKIARDLAAQWLDSSRDLTASGGWSCWNWLLGWRPDGEFELDQTRRLFEKARYDIAARAGRSRIAIRDFIIAAGVSYKPLYDTALSFAQEIDALSLVYDDTNCFSGIAAALRGAAEKGRVGFKRRSVRC